MKKRYYLPLRNLLRFLLLILTITIVSIDRVVGQIGNDEQRDIKIKDAQVEDRKKTQDQGLEEDDRGFIIVGAIILGAVTYTKPSRFRSAFVPRPPAFIVSGALSAYKTKINEHWASSAFASEFEAKLLLIGRRGRYPNFGLYATGSFSSYNHKLPYYKNQYYLSYEFVQDGEMGKLYPLNKQIDEQGPNNKKIQINEKSIDVGLAASVYLRSGLFWDIGGGIKVNRKTSLKFTKNYDYLTQSYKLKTFTYDDFFTTENKPFVFNLSNSFLETGLGYLAEGRVPIQFRLFAKIYQMDYTRTNNYDIVYVDDTGKKSQVDFDQKVGFSINLEMGFAFGRFSN